MDKIIDRPDVTHFFAKLGNKEDNNLKKSKPKVSTVQKQYFTKEKDSYVDSEELDKYIKKVTKAYRRSKRKEWEKAYKENYKTRYPKGGKYPAKI